MKGTLFGVSVGSGDPELITVKAIKTIERCSVIACPQTEGGQSVALNIAKRAMDLGGKRILPLAFLMSKDKAAVQQNHLLQAQRINEFLAIGNDVAMLTLGDISVYSTFSYVAKIVEQSGFEVKRIAGVTGFCACAAAVGEELCEWGEALHIVSARGDIKAALSLSGTKVFMKAGAGLKALCAEIAESNLSQKTVIVENCGMENERIILGGEALPDDVGYFATVIVKG